MATWEAEIQQAARDRMYADGEPFYDDRDPPRIEIVTQTADEVVFVAHNYVYNFAQSGSDWADHYLLEGRARLDGDRVASLELIPHYIHLTERQAEEHNTRDAVNELVAKLSKSPR